MGRGLLILLAVACSPTPVPNRPDPGEPADCFDACRRLRELSCPEGELTPGGATCEQVCENAEASGAVTLEPTCVANIHECAGIEACTYGEP